MSDDALRGDLFGGARPNPSKPNPYAAIPAGGNPFGDTSAGSNPFGGPSEAPAPAPSRKPVTDDEAHAELFSGARSARARTGTGDVSGAASSRVAAPAPAPAPPPPAPLEEAVIPEDDGMLALDYLDDLNLTEGHQRAGGDDAVTELNFDEIDNDLVSASSERPSLEEESTRPAPPSCAGQVRAGPRHQGCARQGRRPAHLRSPGVLPLP